MGKDVVKEGLLGLTDVLGEKTIRLKPEYFYFFDESYPYFERSLVAAMREYYQEEIEKEETLADMAEDKLKRLTKQDFKKDAQAWQKWIEKTDQANGSP